MNWDRFCFCFFYMIISTACECARWPERFFSKISARLLGIDLRSGQFLLDNLSNFWKAKSFRKSFDNFFSKWLGRYLYNYFFSWLSIYSLMFNMVLTPIIFVLFLRSFLRIIRLALIFYPSCLSFLQIFNIINVHI